MFFFSFLPYSFSCNPLDLLKDPLDGSEIGGYFSAEL